MPILGRGGPSKFELQRKRSGTLSAVEVLSQSSSVIIGSEPLSSLSAYLELRPGLR